MVCISELILLLPIDVKGRLFRSNKGEFRFLVSMTAFVVKVLWLTPERGLANALFLELWIWDDSSSTRSYFPGQLAPAIESLIDLSSSVSFMIISDVSWFTIIFSSLISSSSEGCNDNESSWESKVNLFNICDKSNSFGTDSGSFFDAIEAFVIFDFGV